MRPPRQAPALVASWLLTRVPVVAIVLHDLYRPPWLPHDVAHDVQVDYFGAAQGLAAGRVPYLGFHYEYPPGTLPLLSLARLAGGADSQRFTVAWVLLALAADALTLAVLARWAGARAVPVGLVWVAGVAALGPVALLRNDLFVTTAFVLGAFFAATCRPVRSGLAWSAGVLLKLWPATPLAVLLVARRQGRWRLFTAATGVLAGSWMLLTALGAVHPMVSYLSGYQGRRPLEVESMWANAAWLRALLLDHHLQVHTAFQSFDLTSPHDQHLAAWANHATTALQVLTVAGVVTARVRLRRDLSTSTLAWTWLASLSGSFVLAPVLSPQYAVWLVGAAAVVLVLDPGRTARTVALLSVAASGLSQAVFPFRFTELLRGEPLAVLLLTARNLAIVLVLVLAVGELVRRARRRGPRPRTIGPWGRSEVARERSGQRGVPVVAEALDR